MFFITKGIIALALYLLLSVRLRRTAKGSPIINGMWFGAHLAPLAILSLSSRYAEYGLGEVLIRGLVVCVGFYGIGFLIGYLWRLFVKLSPSQSPELGAQSFIKKGITQAGDYSAPPVTSLEVADLSEDDLYGRAMDELLSAREVRGLWARAYAEADGDENKAKAKYIKLRVAQLALEAQAQKYALTNQHVVVENIASQDNEEDSSQQHQVPILEGVAENVSALDKDELDKKSRSGLSPLPIVISIVVTGFLLLLLGIEGQHRNEVRVSDETIRASPSQRSISLVNEAWALMSPETPSSKRDYNKAYLLNSQAFDLGHAEGATSPRLQ